MNFTYVDSHMHFWDQAVLPYPWLAGVPAIADRHTPDELLAEAGDNPPAQIVFVECGAPWLDEVKWVERLAAKEPRVAAIVANLVMNEGAVTSAGIAELKKHPLVRGVRHNIQDQTDPNYCLSPEFIHGVRQLGAAGLSFDLCCRHQQLASVVELVRSCSGTSFVLNHFGKPAIKSGLINPWRDHIHGLAQLPNVVCKFSGLITEADHATWSIDDLRPYFEQVLSGFGAGGMLFGGDWPVVRLAGEYPRWLETARALVSPLSPEEQGAIFAGNARRVYRLP